MAKTRQKDIGDMMDESEAANAFSLADPPATVPIAPESLVAAPKQRAKPRAPDPELKAMGRIGEILRGLTPEAAYRVAKYAMERAQELALANMSKIPNLSWGEPTMRPKTVAEATDGNTR